MALTQDMIKANEVLAELSEDQITAISTLSLNDENTVISSKIGELHGKYDADILASAGVEKNQGEKSYDYMKRAFGGLKTQVDGSAGLATKVTAYEADIANLKKQITDGSTDEVTKQSLRDAEDKLSALQTLYDTDKGNWATEKDEFASKITGIQVSTQFDTAMSGLKFKAGYSDSAKQMLLKSTKAEILAEHKVGWVETDGEKTMVFRDDKGEILKNKNNALNPYTAAELIQEKLKDSLDAGVKKPGGGTGNPGGGGSATIDLVDISGAKTQVQADDIIVKYLMQTGETRGTVSFTEKQMKLRDDNEVAKLPMS